MINDNGLFLTPERNLAIAISSKKIQPEKLLTELNLSASDIVTMNQVHGDKVAWIGKKDLGKEFEKTDGLIAAEQGVFLQARVADCIPIFFFDPKTKVVAVAHSGWRGTLAEIASKLIDELRCEGIDSSQVKVWLGPGARSCCYEVSEELAEKFKEKFGPEVIEIKDEKVYLDLPQAIKKSLILVVVQEENIFDSEICTIHNSDTYHSFRADKVKTSNIALIGYKG